MQTAIKSLNNGLELASVLNFKSGNTTTALKTVTPVYYVEGTIILNGDINVEYTLNDDWFNTVISMAALRSFVLTSGLNEYCYDHSQNGEHVQVCGSHDLNTFMDESLNDAVRAYLRAKKVGQNVN